jgi:hypothetical protein
MYNKKDIETFFKTLIVSLVISRLDEVKTGSFSPSYTRIMNKIAKELNEKINDKAVSEEGVLSSKILRSYAHELTYRNFSQKTLYVWLNALKAVVMHTPEVNRLSNKHKKVIEIELDDICYSNDIFEMMKVQHSTRTVKPLTQKEIISIKRKASKRVKLLIEFLIRTACTGRSLVKLRHSAIKTHGELAFITIPVRDDHSRKVVIPKELLDEIKEEFTHDDLLFADERRKMTRVQLARMITEAGQLSEKKRSLTIHDITHTTVMILQDGSFADREVQYYTGNIKNSEDIKQRMDRRLEDINTLMNEFIK